MSVSMPQTPIEIEITEDLKEILERARLATERSNNPEVVRDALALYDLIVQHLKQGKSIYFGENRESAEPLRIPHLELAAHRACLRLVPDDDKKNK